MEIEKFPFLVHFVLHKEKKIVDVFAVLHTTRNPKIWIERKDNFDK